jgi:hypothetical protein
MINIKLGNTSIGLSSHDDDFLQKARRAYQPFLVNGEPDFRIEFTLDSNLTPSQVKDILKYARPYNDGSRYYTDPDLIDCILDWESRHLSVRTQKALFHDDVEYRLMSYLLRGIYAGITKNLKKSRIQHYIVHGCGIAQGDRYYLFTGVSGSGKTTVARLANGRTVLNDEAVLISCHDDVIRVAGSPLDGELLDKSSKEGDLTAIFFLEHAPEVTLERLSSSRAYHMFLCQVFDISPLFQPSSIETLQERADLSSRVAQSVPCFRLGFRPDNSFWEVVQNAA